MTANQLTEPLLLDMNNTKILVSPQFMEKVDAYWFQPSFWKEQAKSIANGGRGMAWFIDSPEGDFVLRLYGRGGMVVHFTKRAYFFVNRRFVRAFKEFHLLTKLHHAGLNVPRPIAASYHKIAYCWYHAEIIVERIVGALPFADYLSVKDETLWRNVGRLLRRFHDYGVYHADLNCHNILVADSDLYLIDFDKGRLRRGQTWKKNNLKRLKRSIEKLTNTNCSDSTDLSFLWEVLLSGYDNLS
ncbi:3-deoxy-D-manno-octulosonic acid kinase [Legionella brunensis]|uniref:3-deoxy-D-manno-octulosonic acid kinase n=1 Tax=Legionella brunensis TaxID=29422 RepID=A0A0W0SNJ5_9GAMM|nr:3-deoxy-D-manno-octulosonic acid kinase [Legionella brunensis]KTC84907.1 3-deoxy-D-manno-octulosonic acid kinase [Legionella brunensis]